MAARKPIAIRRCDIAKHYSVLTPRTLVHLAHKRLGPPFRLIGRHAVYLSADIDAWLQRPEDSK